ncbi:MULTISPECIES: hypothetical protein [Staphylococcus]|uniref:hypothetical protein n=1 Tax=Staphylococcus TaxID=1279 RepID=UPI0012F0B48B|nr:MULTISPECIES: hypothetical protein [Staphylococcus]MBM6508393.1 hypothetical protein [Staphylococcus pasteuri]MBM6508400.1 hypothetical protein [Staphylococcus pasteuri]QQT21614.1 hypothetical protein I6J08_12800 [Staphylococcus pasteuri]QQT21621.1 hypothetical protein I6J08_12835 [Staphylococcus pasteuri]VXC41572.1 hypothetical protein STAPHY8AQ_110056 [Staphylococcus sp. 8AQ]
MNKKDYKVKLIIYIANHFDDVDYDEVTGKILAGDNVFIFVENHAINTEYKDIADKLVDYVNTNRYSKKSKLKKN